jgi:hypothetical protein
MSRLRNTQRPATAFARVEQIGCSLPNVEAVTRYDGARVLLTRGVFTAGLARHASVEPDTLIVKADVEDRDGYIDEAPDIYYVTDYYRPYPLVLVRLSRIPADALRDLLSLARQHVLAHARRSQRA